MGSDNYWLRTTSARVGRRRFLATGSAGAAGLAALALAGCGDDDSAASNSSSPGSTKSGSSPAAADVKANLNATLTTGIGSDVGSMDPQSLAGTGGGNWPNYAVHFATPMVTDRDTSQAVGYQLDWQWADDNKAIILKAKPGVKFHDGEPLNADQIKFNLDRELGRADYNPKFASGHKTQFTSIGDVTMVDDMTVKLQVISPDIILPSKIATMLLVAKDAVVKQGDTGFAATPVGSGPFKFISRVADSQIKSVRNDDYFYARDQKYAPRLPWIQSLTQKVIPEDTARIAALEAGEIDFAHNVSSDIAKSYKDNKQFTTYTMPGDQPMGIHPNTWLDKDPISGGPNPWRDVRVRQAANMAVDLDTIIKTILTGAEKRTFGSAQRSLGFPKDLPAKAFKYDPTQAKALLTQAGFANGFEANFYYPTGRWPNTEAVVQAVANYLGKIGIRTKLQAQQYQVTTTAFKAHSNDGLTFFGLSGGSDPGPNFRYGYVSDAPYALSNNKALGLDDLVTQSEAAFDPTKRSQLLGQIITKFYEDASWIFLYEPVTIALGNAKKVQWSFYDTVLSVPEYWNMKVLA